MRAGNHPRFNERWEALQSSIGTVLTKAYGSDNAKDYHDAIRDAIHELDKLHNLVPEHYKNNEAPVDTPLGEAMGGE